MGGNPRSAALRSRRPGRQIARREQLTPVALASVTLPWSTTGSPGTRLPATRRMAQGRPRVGLARRSGVGTRAQAGYRKDEVMNQDPGMPLNALDQLRSLTIALRMGVSGEAAAMTLGLEPAAYDFACAHRRADRIWDWASLGRCHLRRRWPVPQPDGCTLGWPSPLVADLAQYCT